MGPAPVPWHQSFIYRLDRPNRRGPVSVYRSGLAGNRSIPVEFKFEFKKLSSMVRTGIPAGLTGLNSNPNLKSHVSGLDRYTGRLDRFTGRLDRSIKWALMGRLIFFFFLF